MFETFFKEVIDKILIAFCVTALKCWMTVREERVCLPADASLLLRILDLSSTSQKDGQPLPESYLVLLEK